MDKNENARPAELRLDSLRYTLSFFLFVVDLLASPRSLRLLLMTVITPPAPPFFISTLTLPIT